MFARGSCFAAATALVLLALPALATADGPCGHDFDGPTACGVNSPGTYKGALTTRNGADYYVFYATRGTALTVTVTNTQEPVCERFGLGKNDCGTIAAELRDSTGSEVTRTGESEPAGGITVPAKFSYTLTESGVHYIVVFGGVAGENRTDSQGNPTPTPYMLSVTAEPRVQWPAPHKKARAHRRRHAGHR